MNTSIKSDLNNMFTEEVLDEVAGRAARFKKDRNAIDLRTTKGSTIALKSVGALQKRR